MSGKTLYRKVWDAHVVGRLPTGQTQVLIGLHLIHEVTSPQAFDMLREQGLKVAFPERTVATVDHIVPTKNQGRPFEDDQAEAMMSALEKNAREFGIRLFGVGDARQGIVHVIGPETGLTQPGMTVACGDSHTSTHGAFGCLAWGIGTSQIKDVLATQSLAMSELRVRRINVNGALGRHITAKDVILAIIRKLGVKGGIGHAYEYGGSAIDRMSMEERMSICNMSIEGGARIGYVNPDETTFAYIRGREFSPKDGAFDRAVAYWKSTASDSNAAYDDVVDLDAASIQPMITWGITPGQAVGIKEHLPRPEDLSSDDRAGAELAYRHMGLEPGRRAEGIPIDVAFIGSCTNSRISDLRAAAAAVKGKKVAPGVRALVVPGSNSVKRQAEAEGLDRIFREAGFEWRAAGCSMCLAMNPDKLKGREVCASSSNRNFIGRQGSPTGRTILMSPVMVVAAAVNGKLTDVREFVEASP
ncbi:3-isopropylmalate dehydratase large subunit [bacterium]|nr:3-isopropylmalate dehydratase large subunit [bacterium]